jgi:hypothetical protein
MRFGKPTQGQPLAPPGRPPVRLGGQKTTQAKSIVDTGETRGVAGTAAQIQGRMGKPLGSTGKGPSSKGKAPARTRVPKGPGMGMLPGIAGPGALPPAAQRPRVATPILAIGERLQLGARTKAAMAKGRPRP